MIYHRYHAARQEKFAAAQAALDSDIAEINGETPAEVVAPVEVAAPQPPAAVPQQTAQQHQHNQQHQKRR